MTSAGPFLAWLRNDLDLFRLKDSTEVTKRFGSLFFRMKLECLFGGSGIPQRDQSSDLPGLVLVDVGNVGDVYVLRRSFTDERFFSGPELPIGSLLKCPPMIRQPRRNSVRHLNFVTDGDIDGGWKADTSDVFGPPSPASDDCNWRRTQKSLFRPVTLLADFRSVDDDWGSEQRSRQSAGKDTSIQLK